MAPPRRTACEICGSPELATYVKRGKVYNRKYCRKHYLETELASSNEYRFKKYGKADEGWKMLRDDRFASTPNYDRITVCSGSNYIRFVRGRQYKTWNYKKLKVLNTRAKVIDFFVSQGYKIIEQHNRMTIMERHVEDRMVPRTLRRVRNIHAASLQARKDFEKQQIAGAAQRRQDSINRRTRK